MATTKKKVVRAASAPQAEAAAASDWKPTAEAKSKATTKRIIAAVCWVVAIGLEAFAIFWVLKQFGDDGIPIFGMSDGTGALILLIILLVVMGVLAVLGSMQWKAANHLDPASRQNAVRFFVQNQLGAIITVIAFLPLIILIFLNKDMDGKQKGIAGAVGIVVLLVAGFLSVDRNPVSTEDMGYDDQVVAALAGQTTAADVKVYWVKGGSVYHVCEAVPDVNRESSSGKCALTEGQEPPDECGIYEGTVAQARLDGKSRLTKKWESEASQYCGISQDRIDAAKAIQEGGAAPAGDTATEPAAEQSSAESAPAESSAAEPATEETP
ncbi:MAG: hypothetical protein LBR32_00015 [Propionibacteriaceae bacterium]|jgi:hypothetical protein|nr:hypothetical protein [Propionibacteriaceae bacterium]